MPISFEQIQPQDSATQQAYGGVEQFQRDRDFALRQAALRQQGGGHGGGGQIIQGGGSGPGGVMGVGGDRGGGGGYHPEPIDHLSQAESIRMQRLQGALSGLQEQLDNGAIDQQTFNDGATQLKTGLDPLVMRQHRAQLQLIEQQKSFALDQHAFQTTIQQQAQTFAAKSIPDRLYFHRDPQILQEVQDELGGGIADTATGPDEYNAAINAEVRRRGGETQLFEQSPGHWVPAGHGAGAGAGGAGEGGGQRAANADTTAEEHYLKEFTRIREHVDKMAKDNPELLGGKTADEVFAARMAEAGLPTNLAAHRADRARQQIRQTVTNQMAAEARRPNPPAWAATPQARQDEEWTRTEAQARMRGVVGAAPAPRPITPGTPVEALDAPQQAAMRALADIRRRAAIYDQQNGTHTWDSLGRAEALFRQYGDRQSMPPNQRTFFNNTIESLESGLPGGGQQTSSQRREATVNHGDAYTGRNPATTSTEVSAAPLSVTSRTGNREAAARILSSLQGQLTGPVADAETGMLNPFATHVVPEEDIPALREILRILESPEISTAQRARYAALVYGDPHNNQSGLSRQSIRNLRLPTTR